MLIDSEFKIMCTVHSQEETKPVKKIHRGDRMVSESIVTTVAAPSELSDHDSDDFEQGLGQNFPFGISMGTLLLRLNSITCKVNMKREILFESICHEKLCLYIFEAYWLFFTIR